MTLNPHQFDFTSVPPEFGTTPIPEGHVRFNHYTRPENVAGIKKHGLKNSKATKDYEPWTFMTAGDGSKLIKEGHTVVEGHVNADTQRNGGQLNIGEYWGRPNESLSEHTERLEKSRSVLTSSQDIPSSQILAVHEPWHQKFRYLGNSNMEADIMRGDYDHAHEYPEYDKPLQMQKAVLAAKVMLGGHLSGRQFKS